MEGSKMGPRLLENLLENWTPFSPKLEGKYPQLSNNIKRGQREN